MRVALDILTQLSYNSRSVRTKSKFREIPFALDRLRRGDLAAQIAIGLRMAIETGYYKAGDVLPPIRDLAPMLDVSKGIAEQALALVREEGLISPPRAGSTANIFRWAGRTYATVRIPRPSAPSAR